MISADELWPELDELGEAEVRKRLSQGVYGQQKLPLIHAWLAKKEGERADTATQRQEIRESKALELSAEANSIARGSNAIAWIAAVISALALLVSMWVALQ